MHLTRHSSVTGWYFHLGLGYSWFGSTVDTAGLGGKNSLKSHSPFSLFIVASRITCLDMGCFICTVGIRLHPPSIAGPVTSLLAVHTLGPSSFSNHSAQCFALA